MYKDESEYKGSHSQTWLDEIANIMSYEIQAEIDKEMIAKITNIATTYTSASSAYFYYPPQEDKMIIG